MGLLPDRTPATGAPGRNTPQTRVVLSRIPVEESGLQERFERIQEELLHARIAFETIDSLYDLQADDAQLHLLREAGELVLLGWHYPRALKWIVARQGRAVHDPGSRVHCLDLREGPPASIVRAIGEILAGRAQALVQTPRQDPLPGALTPRQRGELAERQLPNPENAELSPRWYPVVDYDVCTNCMECLDFCLFGVYGVDHQETLRVVQQDECRTDCPACSRVCPVGAILFPKYKTNPTIAGGTSDGDRGSLKLDLSKIFGKPKARHQAALERDRELLKAGRQPPSAERLDRLAKDFEGLEL